ncbi:MAG: pseudouridine synthase [Actinomycetota bacterium]
MTESAEPAPIENVRLQKALAARGIGSRRVVEDMIADGRITVNGEVAKLGRRINPERDMVEVDGVLVGVAPDAVHYLVHKPNGVVSTAADTHDRPIVTELVPDEPRVWPVGRLDLETEGLLIITNDGELTHRLTHPSFGVDKEYLAELDREPSRGDLRAWREGIELDDGMTAPAKASLLAPTVLRLTIHEGRNRQVRRMCDARGYRVRRLVRTRIGPLTDTVLKPGEWRDLTPQEVRSLEAATGRASADTR